MVNVMWGLADGYFPAKAAAWLVVVAGLISPYPFRLMRRRILRKTI
jgi:hypothetical protein